MFEKIWLNICLLNESNNIPCVRSRTRAGVICASIKYIMILLVLRKQFASSAYCVNSWILSDSSVYEYLFIDLWICVFVFSTISIYSRVIVWCTSRIPGYRCGKVTLIEKDLSFSFVVAIQEFDVLRYLFSIRPIFLPFILICIIRAFLT